MESLLDFEEQEDDIEEINVSGGYTGNLGGRNQLVQNLSDNMIREKVTESSTSNHNLGENRTSFNYSVNSVN